MERARGNAFVPFSYFCICWKVTPRASATYVWLLPPSSRAARKRAPTGFSTRKPSYFVPHFDSRTSPIVPPEMTSPCTGLPRKMILVSSLYAFGPDPFPRTARGFHEALVKRFSSAGERLVRPLLGDAGNGSSNRQHQRHQYGRMQAHNGLRWLMAQKITHVRLFGGPNARAKSRK
jgi:hypothetical protein